MDIENKLKSIFSDVFNIQLNTVNNRINQDNLKEWDSLGKLRLIMALEEAFEISFAIEEFALLTDFETVLNEISKKLSTNDIC